MAHSGYSGCQTDVVEGCMELEAVVSLEERVEEKVWEPFKHCIHVCPWIPVRGAYVSDVCMYSGSMVCGCP